jgi:hypothetical protein
MRRLVDFLKARPEEFALFWLASTIVPLWLTKEITKPALALIGAPWWVSTLVHFPLSFLIAYRFGIILLRVRPVDDPCDLAQRLMDATGGTHVAVSLDKKSQETIDVHTEGNNDASASRSWN